MLSTKIVFLFLFWHSKQYLYTTCCELVFLGEFNEQSLVIFWVNWCKNEGFWKRFTCTLFNPTGNQDANKIYRLVLLPIGEYVLTSINLTALSVPKWHLIYMLCSKYLKLNTLLSTSWSWKKWILTVMQFLVKQQTYAIK